MSTIINSPLPVFLGPDGPIKSGNLYIGNEDTNPVTNTQPVFWDNPLTIRIQQPLKVVNGYVVNPSTNQPAPFFMLEDTYSMLLQDSNTLVTILSLPSITASASSTSVASSGLSLQWSPGNGIIVPTDSSGSNRVTGQTISLSVSLGTATVPPTSVGSDALMPTNSWRVSSASTGTGLSVSTPVVASTSISWSVVDLSTQSSYFQPVLVYKDINGKIIEVGPSRIGAVQQRSGPQGNIGATGPSGVGIDISNAGGITYDVNSNVYFPSQFSLFALVNGITNPYTLSWSIVGATPATGTGETIVLTPIRGSVTFAATLTATDSVTGKSYSKIVTIPVIQTGQNGVSGVQNASISIYQWTSSANPPTAPGISSTYTWATGNFTAPIQWSSSIPVNTTPGSYLWEITAPLTAPASATTTTVNWNTYPVTCSSYNGLNGASGPRSALLNLYQWGANAPTTFPSGNTTVTWGTSTFTLPTTPNGWTIEANPAGIVAGSKLWQLTQYVADSLTTPTSTFSWTAASPVPIGQAGAAGAPGQRTTTISLYQWALVTPTNFPTGTSTYTWADGSFTPPSISAAGWSTYAPPPQTGATLYQISAYYTDNLTTATSTISWNNASQTLSQIGASPLAPASTVVVTLYQWTYFNTAPTVSRTGTATFLLASNTISGGPGPLWTTSVQNSDATYLWAINALGVDISRSGSYSIPNSSWSSPAIVSQRGLDGLSYYPVTVFQWANAQPSLPSNASVLSLATGQISGLNNGWGNTPGNTAFGNLYTARYFVTGITAGQTSITLNANAWIYGGIIGAPGNPGSATFLIQRSATGAQQPTNAEVQAAIGRNPVLGDIATVVSQGITPSVTAYNYQAAGWSLLGPYLSGTNLFDGTLDNTKLNTNFVLNKAISVGSAPVRTGTTMTGSGMSVELGAGATAIGDTNSNFVFDGNNTFLTDTKVSNGNAAFSTDATSGQVTFTGAGTLITSGGQFGVGNNGRFIAFDGNYIHSSGVIDTQLTTAQASAPALYPSNSVLASSFPELLTFTLATFTKKVIITINFTTKVSLQPTGDGLNYPSAYYESTTALTKFYWKTPGASDSYAAFLDATDRSGRAISLNTRGDLTLPYNRVRLDSAGSITTVLTNAAKGTYSFSALFDANVIVRGQFSTFVGPTYVVTPTADSTIQSSIVTYSTVQFIF